MLEFVIAVLPGILAFFIFRYFFREHSWKRLLSGILFYTVAANLLIFIGLKLIGMQSFNLFEMSVRFKVKWIVLEIIAVGWFTWIIRNICKTDLVELKQILQRLFPATFFFIVTYAVFTPSALFLENIHEFSLSYINIVPVILCMTLLLFAIIYFIALWLIREKALPFYIALIFSFSVSIYIQSNFLNTALPILDGTTVQWENYRTENLISILVWSLCFIFVFAFTYFGKKKFEAFVKYGSYFLGAVQLVTLVVLIFSNPLEDKASWGFSKEGQFTIGSKENVVIFIIDTMQEDLFEEYLMSDGYKMDGTLNDFTLFENAVSGGAPTTIAMPLFLTGSEYDPSQNYLEYLKEAWNETPLYNDLHQNGYDVRLYSTPVDIIDISEGIFDNYMPIGKNWIEDYKGFGSSLYQATNYLLMPQFLKERFWLSTETFMYNVKSAGYELNDIYFHNDFVNVNETLKVDYEKAFRLYHLNGLHAPYNMTEDFNRVWDYGVAELNVLQGDMRIVYAYIKEMKRLGVYDASMIIIAGDHGKHDDGNPETNPAVLIKLPMEKHELEHNSAPIHFRNILPTIAGTFLDDYSVYGPSVYDITEESDVERLHTVDRSVTKRINLKNQKGEFSMSRLIIKGDADAWNYKLWNPREINRIDYQLGDVIDFTSDNKYADQIDYRLYKENGAATASNELSICFCLKDGQKKDMELHFVCSDFYNKSQKIAIYAGGDRVGSEIYSQDSIGKETVIKIPADCIQDELLTVRMVFPNAVTPNQLDRNNPDKRVLSVVFDSMWLE